MKMKNSNSSKSNILDTIKLDKALRLAKQKSKDGKIEEAKIIYEDILQKFSKNKKALSELQLLVGVRIVEPREPPSKKLQSLINLFTQGQLQQVLSQATQMLESFPNSVILYNIIGASNSGLMQFDAAINSYKQALKIKPNYAVAYYNIGIALSDKGESEAAIDSYKKALKIKPDYANAYNNIASILKDKGDTGAAIDCYKKALKINPNYFDAYNNMGNALKDKGDISAAIDCYKKALKIKPEYAEAYYNMGNTLDFMGNPDAAIDCYKKALKIKPDYAEAYFNMGNTLKDKGDSGAAIDCYKKALKIKPDYSDAFNNMGVALNDKGEFESAINCYKKAIKINDYAEAYRNISALTSYKEYDKYFIKMQSLCLDPLSSDEERCHLNFALSKASEDLNEIEKSFNYLKMGNALRTKIISYDIKQDIELFSQLKKAYPSIALKSTSKISELKPVFILGMPRSGTTLVEQVVSSHSKVTGAGELSYVKMFGSSIARGVIRANDEIILGFRERYIEALKIRSDDRSIVTDKMPHNFLYVGLIFSAFPDAKIIHVNRDPAATCWSNYKHYFATKGLGYCYDLDDTVSYFGLYKDLMQFWLGHYGDRIYNLNYENLTINQDVETRKLIRYLGLEWEDECLSPQQNKRAVRTASQKQVRQKVYQGSSEQWRKFEPYLNGAFDLLSELN
jgi:tetratricopeptide (TPR) repeat protein